MVIGVNITKSVQQIKIAVFKENVFTWKELRCQGDNVIAILDGQDPTAIKVSG